MDSIPVIIIGAGPSGLAAAIQLKRQGIECLVFERAVPGGLLNNANLIENYPGFPGGIRGIDFASLIIKQAEQNEVRIISEEVIDLNFKDTRFAVLTKSESYQAQIVIVATGTIPKGLPEPVIPDDCRERIHYEIYKLSEMADKTFVVIGAGDAAFDYALNLSVNNKRVVILNRGDKSSALKLLQERVKSNLKIDYYTNHKVKSVSKNSDNMLAIKISGPAGLTDIESDHLVVAIGRKASDNLITGELGHQISRLQTEGRLYIIGDVTAGIFRQSSIAIGEAVRAAMLIQTKLKELK